MMPDGVSGVGVLPLDMVDNSAGLLERSPGRAGLASARGSRTSIRPGHAVFLVAPQPLVARCTSFACACPVRVPRPRNSGFPSNHAECELSTMSRGTTLTRVRGRCYD